jgi:hypothetical protein
MRFFPALKSAIQNSVSRPFENELLFTLRVDIVILSIVSFPSDALLGRRQGGPGWSDPGPEERIQGSCSVASSGSIRV